MPAVEGVVVPLITPFKEDLAVDYEALGWLLDRLAGSGVHGVFPSSTTGEFPHLTLEEVMGVNEFTTRRVSGRVKVYAGVTANTTHHAVKLARHAEDVGADGVIATTPYYFKHGEDSVREYYAAIASSVDIHVIMYVIPSTTGILPSPGLVAGLAREFSNLVAVKVTYESLTYLMRLVDEVSAVRKDFSVLTGGGYQLLPALAIGCRGGVLALANAYPRTCVEVFRRWVEGDMEGCVRAYRRVVDLSRLYLHGEAAAVIKALLSLGGAPVKPIVRPPMKEPDRPAIEAILGRYPIEL